MWLSAQVALVRERFECVITDQPTRYREVVLTPLPLRSERLCQKSNILRTCYTEEAQRHLIIREKGRNEALPVHSAKGIPTFQMEVPRIGFVPM
jgi:hypothetical protein